MGSPALTSAIKGIVDWSMTDGKTMSPIAKATDIFGSQVFND